MEEGKEERVIQSPPEKKPVSHVEEEWNLAKYPDLINEADTPVPEPPFFHRQLVLSESSESREIHTSGQQNICRRRRIFADVEKFDPIAGAFVTTFPASEVTVFSSDCPHNHKEKEQNGGGIGTYPVGQSRISRESESNGDAEEGESHPRDHWIYDHPSSNPSWNQEEPDRDGPEIPRFSVETWPRPVHRRVTSLIVNNGKGGEEERRHAKDEGKARAGVEAEGERCVSKLHGAQGGEERQEETRDDKSEAQGREDLKHSQERNNPRRDIEFLGNCVLLSPDERGKGGDHALDIDHPGKEHEDETANHEVFPDAIRKPSSTFTRYSK